MEIICLISIVIFQFVILIWLFFRHNQRVEIKPVHSFNNPQRVGEFYNQTTDKFLEVYGEIIQAFRTKDVKEYLNYTKDSMQIRSGMKILDAGCGVCGPACFFAEEIPDLSIEAITVSAVQVEKSKTKIIERNLNDRINVQMADYHKLNLKFEMNSFDRVYFLESFGHSDDKEKAISSAWNVLKPGGKIYIKDLFLRISDSEWEQLKINEIAEQINNAYEYQISDLNEILTFLRKKGFILQFVKVPEVNRDAFENLSISNDFQNLFNIGKIESWDDYIFPIDFYEILAEKPQFNSMKEMHLYYMNRK